VAGRIPRVYRAEAVVLRQRRLGEADRIVTLFTPQLGKIDAVAKGIRKQTSRKAGHLEQLSLTSLLLASGKNLDIITQGETIEGFMPLRQDLERLARGLYVAELVDRFSELRTENYPVFRLLVETLQRLSSTVAVELAVRYFELHLLSHLGYRPELGRCVACRADLEPVENSFSAALGGVVCPECRYSNVGLWRLSVNALKVLRLLERGSFEDAERLRLTPELSMELELLLQGYVRHVLERNPRSLEFVDAVRRTHDSRLKPALALVAESAAAYEPGN
jgi:DNA repair protein RecO (recombination protein O)